MPSSDSFNWKGCATIFGGVLINITCGTLYSFGNMTPYVVSYIRKHGRESNLTYQFVVVCGSLLFASCGTGIVIGTWMEKKYGVMKTILFASILDWIGLVSSFWSVGVSFYFFLFTYGCVFGFSSGLGYAPTVISGLKWFPRRRGLVSGILLGFFGLGGMILDVVQTLYINPHNHEPNSAQTVGERKEIYFTQDSVLNQTPYAFLLQAGLSAILQVTGLMLQYEPRSDSSRDTEMETLLDNQEENTSKTGEDTVDSLKMGQSPKMNMITEPPEHSRHFHRATSLDTDTAGCEEGQNDTPTAIRNQGVVPERTLESQDTLGSGLSLHTSQVIRLPYFWQYLAMGASCTFTGVYFASCYKAFGIGFIRDDLLLAGVGSTASIFSFLGHLMTGVTIDHYSIKATSISLCAMMSASVLLVSVSSLGKGVTPFFIVVCAVFFFLGGAFAIQPVITIRAFGEEHLTGNMMLTTLFGFVVPSMLASLAASVPRYLSWETLFIFFGLAPGAAMFPGMFMNLKNQQGHDL